MTIFMRTYSHNLLLLTTYSYNHYFNKLDKYYFVVIITSCIDVKWPYKLVNYTILKVCSFFRVERNLYNEESFF